MRVPDHSRDVYQRRPGALGADVNRDDALCSHAQLYPASILTCLVFKNSSRPWCESSDPQAAVLPAAIRERQRRRRPRC